MGIVAQRNRYGSPCLWCGIGILLVEELLITKIERQEPFVEGWCLALFENVYSIRSLRTFGNN